MGTCRFLPRSSVTRASRLALLLLALHAGVFLPHSSEAAGLGCLPGFRRVWQAVKSGFSNLEERLAIVEQEILSGCRELELEKQKAPLSIPKAIVARLQKLHAKRLEIANSISARESKPPVFSISKDFVGEQFGVSRVINYRRISYEGAGLRGKSNPFFLRLERGSLTNDLRETRERTPKPPRDPGRIPSTQESADPNAIEVVMDVDGNFYGMGLRQKSDLEKHSTYLGGAPVAFGGTIVVRDGKLIEIGNDSGHYLPSMESIEVAIRQLKRMGIDTSDVVVKPWGRAPRRQNY